MNEIKYDKTLENLMMNIFFTSPKRPTIVTPELFLKTVIDAFYGEIIITLDSNNKSAVKKILNEYFPECQGDYKTLKTDIEDYLANGQSKENEIACGFIMSQIERRAKRRASILGLDVLTVEMILKSILLEPTRFLATTILKYKGLSKDVPMQQSAHDSFADKKDINEIFEKKDGLSVSGNVARSAITELTEKTKKLRDYLLNTVFGQNNAVNVFVTGYFQSELMAMTEEDRSRPKAMFLFAGPPGVGKTFLAETAAKYLKIPSKRFDMSEYCNKESSLEFIGSDAVYKDSKKGNFTQYVEENPKSIIILDEIEKAHISIIHLFLQIMDAGEIRDSKSDKPISLKDVILIFTTNAGKSLYEETDRADLSSLSRKVVINALKTDTDFEGAPLFPPAICSRFASGNIVMFNHLDAYNLLKIERERISKLTEEFDKKFNIRIEFGEPVYTALLYSAGGNVDGRMVNNRTDAFFNDELFELFRLVVSEKENDSIERIENVKIDVELPTDNEEILSYFVSGAPCEVLLYSSEETFKYCIQSVPEISFLNAGRIPDARNLLKKHDVSYILVDMEYGLSDKREFLNFEDVKSKARDFLQVAKDEFGEIPIYLFRSSEINLSDEESFSFYREGIRGIFIKGSENFRDLAKSAADQIYSQNKLVELAKVNKLIDFETAQILNRDRKSVFVKLFDFKLSVAVDAEDSKNILSNVSKSDVSFKDIIGAKDAKNELEFFKKYLMDPNRYLSAGLEAPKGIIFYGPPGTGKTMLAKAMAAECGATFITATGSTFIKKYVGEGSDKIREMFRTARKYAPSVIFIDEIDALGKQRTGEDTTGREGTMTTLLAEMDGFKNNPDKPVLVMAATNFDVKPGSAKSLDEALVRRFDRHIFVDLPDRSERIEFMEKRFENNKAFALTKKEIENIAMRSTGMSLSNLSSVIDLALRTAIMSSKLKVTYDILETAFEIFSFGESRAQTEEQLLRTARHESGHALLCWLSGETPSYVTVVSRGNHGGYMMHADNEEKTFYTKAELKAKIRTALGGRAAELVYYGDDEGITTTISADLRSANQIAREIVCNFGMSEKVGLLVFDNAGENEVASLINSEMRSILSEQMEKAIELVKANREAIDALVDELLLKEHIVYERIDEILGKYCKR